MPLRIVHKASTSKKDHSAYNNNNNNTTTMAKGKAPATSAPEAEREHHDPDDPSYDPRLDPDVGPYDPDNDYLPDEGMTDQEAAQEIFKITKEEKDGKREFNSTFYGGKAPKAPTMRPQPKKPCDNCKSLKKGCDRLVPTCTKCQARGIPCVYSRG